jgi:hypothetical protein
VLVTFLLKDFFSFPRWRAHDDEQPKDGKQTL